MNLDYIPAIIKRAQHSLTINGEAIITTNAKEILNFAKPRMTDRRVWKELKEAVRLGQRLTIREGI